MEKNKHIYYFDWLRVVAMFGVIAIHAFGFVHNMGFSVEWGFVNLVMSLVYTSVPLFFMISGYLSLSDERTADVSIMLKKRIPKILLPLIVWTVVSVVLNCLLSHDLSLSGIVAGIRNSLASPAWPHLWYLYTLLTITIIAPILYNGIKHLSKAGHILVIAVIAVITLRMMLQALLPSAVDAWLNIKVIKSLELFSGNLSIFILGYYLGSLKKKIPNWILALVFVGTLMIIVGGTSISYWRSGTINKDFQDQSTGFEILLAASIFLLFKQNITKPSRLLRIFPIAPLSFGIYLCHDIVLAFIRRWTGLSSFIGSAIWVVATFVVCYLMIKTIATIKPLCYIVTGMSYEQACNSCNWVYTFRKLKRNKD